MKKLAVTIFVSSFALMMLGLVMVMSASSTYSALKFDNTFYLFDEHIKKVAFGLVFLFGAAILPYNYYKRIAKPAIFVTTLLLLLTLILSVSLKGASRWLSIGVFSFQPSDLARLALIIYLAYFIEKKEEVIKSFKYGYLIAIAWIASIALLILAQPNVSSAALISFIGIMVLYVGGANGKHIAATLVPGILFGSGMAMAFSHSRERILDYVNSMLNGTPLNDQVKQALRGFGSGGIFGVGIGHSQQSNLFLPEAYGDFIFAIIGEEAGFVGAFLVIACFFTIFFCGIMIAKKTKDKFGQLLAFGITLNISIFAFANMLVATGMIPTTGLPLPFISYGGTSLIFISVSTGILMNIAFTNAIKINKEQVANNALSVNEELVNEFSK